MENKRKLINKKAGATDGGKALALDDARRIKVLSPSMLVFKRFIRNKLAIIGSVIIILMFLFSFVGALISPYAQTQVFRGEDALAKDYASAIYNDELRYVVVEGETFASGDRAQFMLAKGKGETVFASNGVDYFVVRESDGFYRIMQLDAVYNVVGDTINPVGGADKADLALESAYFAAVGAKKNAFQYKDVTYRIKKDGKFFNICVEHDVAIATLNVFDAYTKEDASFVASYAFRLNAEYALLETADSFSVGDVTYTISYEDGKQTIQKNGVDFAEVSDIIVSPLDQSIFLTVDYKAAVRETITAHETEFDYETNGETVNYNIVRVNKTYNVQKETMTELIRMYEPPSGEHWLGLDNNGMDNLTRLMYGGQVSLLVGFVVIFIEMFIGVIIGGISGYFGGWVDTALMRFVDLFNSIPFYPMVIIAGSVMDTLDISPKARIFLLMFILGVLGWTGVARVVRGQILSLREQDFMVATEATGIRTSRRIFKHLVPNVMPLLIVQATAGLGGVIISEATLGFLGLGVKYPLASWGSIINVASDAHVMTKYWFMWIPAGLLILLTVLGFNFVGDGLRDAFDPKMKR